jgi:polyisoprenoid-binding protein YceI
MKTALLVILLPLAFTLNAGAQKFITKTGHIRFYSDSPLEKIEANNRQVNSAMDAATGDFVFRVLMKSFQFEKALMQEHFNENYVESDKFPNATFLGKITNIKEVDQAREAIYPVTVAGKLTIHGVTKEVSVKGTFEVKPGKMLGKAKFNILLSDFNISIPSAVKNNISNSVEVTVDVVLEKFTSQE